MSPVVLLVHSAGPQVPGEGSEPFASRLRDELGPGFEILFPIMPDPESPHYGPWGERLGEILGGVRAGDTRRGSEAAAHAALPGSIGPTVAVPPSVVGGETIDPSAPRPLR